MRVPTEKKLWVSRMLGKAHDPKVDAMYIELAQGKYSKTRKVSDVILVDEDKDGKVLGIEILDATANIPAFDPQKMNVSVQSS